MEEKEKIMRQCAEAYAKIDIIDRKIKLALDDLNGHNELQIKKFLTDAYYDRMKLKQFLRDCHKAEVDIAGDRAIL